MNSIGSSGHHCATVSKVVDFGLCPWVGLLNFTFFGVLHLAATDTKNALRPAQTLITTVAELNSFTKRTVADYVFMAVPVHLICDTCGNLADMEMQVTSAQMANVSNGPRLRPKAANSVSRSPARIAVRADNALRRGLRSSSRSGICC
jgi:hypothetical protein